ncbi:uncharacterized protein LOC130446220 [Diorhabda sublineata]|uniref:uncharacterized protein LOC130446220 n=1 Tax=Diorhabda sublineata TaxID=1163346 RepID=UPI0024E13EB7|nr:uncharacterized protein LOC130446220 [Diorhabda sublineata]
MTNKQTKKAKRPLQTTLGKAPVSNEKEEIDLSLIKKPIETSIYGLHQVLNLLKTATEEVKDYITYECDIMYECRLCRSIFRSIANFILHKRNYCHMKYKAYASNCREINPTEKVYPPESPESMQLMGEPAATKGLIPVIEKLKEKQEIKQLTQELLSADLSAQKKNEPTENSTENSMLLEKISTNNAAVFQTVLHKTRQQETTKPEFMKKEVLELHKILDSDKAALGTDGKICSFQTGKLNSNSILPKTELMCSECNIKFSTRKTLSFHLKTKHNNSRLVYVCPDCKETYANAWSVYRHLFKVHRKSSAQVKRLREQIYNSVIRKDQESHKKVEKKEFSNQDKADEENQWLNNIEGDNDFQMCGGCGKRFERKAALHSHAAMCIKRIAVCNTIKENNAKKKEELPKDTKTKLNKIEKTTDSHPKGALKRKPYLLRTYKQPVEIQITCDTNLAHRNSDECDFYDDNSVKTNCDYSKVKTRNNATVSVKSEVISSNSLYSDSEKMETLESQINEIERDHRIEVIKEVSPSQVSDTSSKNSDKKVGKRVSDEDISDSQQSYDSNETDKDSLSNLNDTLEFQSPGKISIRSLEELRGFPKETIDEDTLILEPSKPNKSPKSSKRMIKRKRTPSSDSDQNNKSFKQSDFDVLLDKQDLNFMARASPYIDRKNLTCKSCQTQHPSLSKLLWHMSAHFSWFRYQCSRCSFVSFGKPECANHAKSIHDIRDDEIANVVLPIPNWKTLLLSNEFKELNSSRELGGKLTDEINVNCQDEPSAIKNNEEDQSTNLLNTLFVDSESDQTDLQDLTDIRSFSMPKMDEVSIKNESIDITEDDHENFQLEVPEEIYTLDVFEVINIDAIEDKAITYIKEEIEDVNDESVVPNCSRVTPTPPNEDLRGFDNLNKIPSNNPTNIRPTRNRMRSIKTLQNDFFYDLDRANKPPESVSKTNGPVRQKKNHHVVKKE